MLVQKRTPQLVRRYAALLAFVAFVPLAVAVATFLAGGAAFLSVWVVMIVFAMLGTGLLAYAGPASSRIERLFFYVMLASVFLTVAWPRYASVRLPGLPALPPSRVALFVLALMFVYLLVKKVDFRSHLFQAIHRHGWVVYPLLAVLCWRLIGISTSELPFVSTRGVLNELLSVYLPLLAALAIVRTRRDIHAVLVTFLAATAVVVAIALYEFSISRNVFYGLLEIDSEYLERSLREKLRDGSYRLQATFFHPLVLSEFLVLMVPVAIYMAFVDGFRWLRSLALLVLAAFATFVIFETGSRSGVGGFAVVLGLTVIMAFLRLALRSRDPVIAGFYWLGILATVFAGAMAVFLILEFLVGTTSETRASGMLRLLMWETGLTRAAERPILGWGQNLAAEVLGFVAGQGILTIDSYYLSVLLDAGYPALALYLFAIAAAVVTFFRHGVAPGETNLLAALMMSGVVAFALIKVVLSLDHNHGLLMVLLATTMASLDLSRRALPATAPARPARGLRWA